MLSDACFDFLSTVYESGVTPAMYEELKADIQGYSQAPFDYPADVCTLLLLAVEDMAAGGDDVGPIRFMELLTMTLRAYDSVDENAEASLYERLSRVWSPRQGTVLAS